MCVGVCVRLVCVCTWGSKFVDLMETYAARICVFLLLLLLLACVLSRRLVYKPCSAFRLFAYICSSIRMFPSRLHTRTHAYLLSVTLKGRIASLRGKGAAEVPPWKSTACNPTALCLPRMLGLLSRFDIAKYNS